MIATSPIGHLLQLGSISHYPRQLRVGLGLHNYPLLLQVAACLETVAAEGRIDDVRVVEHDAALAQKIATDIGKTGLPIARGHVRNSFVARVKLEPLSGVFGQQQHRVVV